MENGPMSRRERPAKPALSRSAIVDAALSILENEGFEKVTMRRVATELDTAGASLYVYVRNAEDLHLEILDALIARMPAIPATGSWRVRLHALLVSYAGVLVDYPDIARVSLYAHPTGPRFLGLIESILELLEEGGIPDRSAAWGVNVILETVTSAAVEHAPDAAGAGAFLPELDARLALISPQEHPRIVQLSEQLLAGTGEQRFHWAIDLLLNGLLATPVEPGEGSR
ncbi:TetR/AcrR family transcriptional regulator [Humibacter ginsenosidimutans]|uniref:TetR family transcriptional regulator n=1 Tax=Humibacter ginsenosidimutans TaxID=2599293 RepID=A0A5B8M6R5_9MICO|nr:TetR/AcrR family transcriptional regulator C-terminal domain-containing protein [Humibacter ginsenosidimutans]QDZ15819.1 TetR family transcriptional regulator [Humibacter ginsenosidimutans]